MDEASTNSFERARRRLLFLAPSVDCGPKSPHELSPWISFFVGDRRFHSRLRDLPLNCWPGVEPTEMFVSSGIVSKRHTGLGRAQVHGTYKNAKQVSRAASIESHHATKTHKSHKGDSLGFYGLI